MAGVEVAVVPCAGLGTRLRPLTRAVPKELIPFGDRPMLDCLLQELQQAGIRRIVVVTRPDKPLIREHLAGLPLEFVEQDTAAGLWQALRCCRARVGSQPFLMALPDQHLAGAASQLLAAYTGQDSLSALVDIPPEEVEYFPGAAVLRTDGCRVLGIAGPEARSPRRCFGRTIFNGGFLATEGEDIGEAFLRFLASGTHEWVQLTGRPCDLGTLRAYLFYQREWFLGRL